MAALDLKRKLSILSDAAKYDASCASSGATGRDSRGGRGVGSAEGMGICHAYTPDGRCVSLLKILLTNFCIYDCAYCINRVSSNTPRARLKPEEVADLTIAFYKRNYIEGLFLSSGVIRSPDATMEEMIEAARLLREVHDFRGYIHLKVIAGADPGLLERAGLYADRLSVNIELPREESLKALAPEKDPLNIRRSMGKVRFEIEQARPTPGSRTRPRRFAPAGQSTQLIVGADTASDGEILAKSEGLYAGYGLRRVYYSAFSPIPEPSARLRAEAPPLLREHRLYQADWLMRFYGFGREEIVSDGAMLDLEVDPKLAWALANRHRFPVDLNRADRETLLRVPGLGVRSVDRLIVLRRNKRLRISDLRRLGRSVEKLKPFILADDWRPRAEADADILRAALSADPAPAQLELF